MAPLKGELAAKLAEGLIPYFSIEREEPIDVSIIKRTDVKIKARELICIYNKRLYIYFRF